MQVFKTSGSRDLPVGNGRRGDDRELAKHVAALAEGTVAALVEAKEWIPVAGT